MNILLLFALLQFQADGTSVGQPLRSGCSPDDEQIGSVSATDRVEVQSALAGGGPTCYKITVTRGETSQAGYLLGDSLPAIDTFIQRREKASEEAAREEARLALEASRVKPRAIETAKSADPLVSTQFADFAGRDAFGKTVSLSGLRGKVTVVTFWSPGSTRSISELTRVLPVYNEFHKRGLAAIGVSMDPKTGSISEALDDITLPWSQIPDHSGLAARYQVDPKAGKTFVLDASHRIVAAGPMGPEIVKAVRQLMDPPSSSAAGQ